MRISKAAARVATGAVLTALAGGLCIVLGFGPSAGPDFARGQSLSLQPALAFDGATTPATASLTPPAGLPATEGAPEVGLKAKQFSALQYAADQGHPSAQWKLGRMYADGDGVPRDDLRAFEYFSRIANSHADEPPGTRQALMVADAFVALGRYYLKGIPNSTIKSDPARARAMFAYAASYFGDADAQYELGRLYLDGKPSDEHEAARWLLLAATKGHCRAQVVLGDLLFRGRYVPRQAARGLMWLTLGRDCAGTDEGWVKPLYDSDIRRASDDERALALVYLKDWINGRRY
jgi:TPR repeat protein